MTDDCCPLTLVHLRLLAHSTLCFSAQNVMSILGRKFHGKFEGDVVTDQVDHALREGVPNLAVKRTGAPRCSPAGH